MKSSSAKKGTTQEKRLRDEVGRSGVYPVSGPLPESDAPIRGQLEWGQGERGAAGYENHGSSELSFQGGSLLGGLDEEWAELFGKGARQSVDGHEVPLASWTLFCKWFTRHYAGITTTISFTDGHPGFPVAARRLALVRLEAHVLENKVAAISVQLDRKPTDYLLNITGPRRLTYMTNAKGSPKLVRIERAEGAVALSFEGAA